MYLDDILFKIMFCIKLNKKHFETKFHALIKKNMQFCFTMFFHFTFLFMSFFCLVLLMEKIY